VPRRAATVSRSNANGFVGAARNCVRSRPKSSSPSAEMSHCRKYARHYVACAFATGRGLNSGRGGGGRAAAKFDVRSMNRRADR